jgi:hypothetical protein
MEVYFSSDIESDGPIPGEFSMLSFASAAFDNTGKLLGTFSRNLELLPGAKQNPETMKFLGKNQAAYDETRKDIVSPLIAMKEYVEWITTFQGKPVFVGFPVAFDFMFVYWYLLKFYGSSPFSHSALDIKTMAMIALNEQFRNSTKRNMPKRWFSGCGKHTHVAIDDAIEQGILFFNIKKEIMK